MQTPLPPPPKSTPQHYNNGQAYDVIDIVKDYDLNFNEGNALKYIVRARHKGQHLDDLRKAIDYLQRELDYHNKVKCNNRFIPSILDKKDLENLRKSFKK